MYAEGADILRSGNKPLAVPYTRITKPGMVDDAFAGYTETSPVAADSDGNILFVGQFKAMVVSSPRTHRRRADERRRRVIRPLGGRQIHALQP
ncbi:MAG: hypothetical protein ACLR5G_04500 [Eubacteriales bacterium]